MNVIFLYKQISRWLNNTSSRIKRSQYWCFWFDKTVVSSMCTVASLHTLHTDLLVDMFKKIWNISFIIVDYYHPHQTFKCRLTHSSCIPTIFKESEVKWGGGGGFAYLRGVLVWYYCLGVGYLLREKPFSEHVLNLYLGNLFLIYSALCWKLKKLDHSLFLRTLALISRMGDLVSSVKEAMEYKLERLNTTLIRSIYNTPIYNR